MSASEQQLASHRKQARGVPGVRARSRVVARLAWSRRRQTQRDRGRRRGGVEAEHDHREPSRVAGSAPSSTSIRRRSPPSWLSVTRMRAPRELGVRVLRPLDERDAPGAEVVGEQIGILALEARQAVEVEVRDADVRPV